VKQQSRAAGRKQETGIASMQKIITIHAIRVSLKQADTIW
jgi:hypothetical protein